MKKIIASLLSVALTVCTVPLTATAHKSGDTPVKNPQGNLTVHSILSEKI